MCSFHQNVRIQTLHLGRVSCFSRYFTRQSDFRLFFFGHASGSFHDEGTKRNYDPPCRKESSVLVDNKSKKTEIECHEIPDTSALTHSVTNTSSSNLTLPAPSWCSPVGTPGTIVKPSCTSTPKDSIQENIKEMVKHFSPSEPDRLIGRKMGLDFVDVVSELHIRSVCSLETIFRHLKSEDLCR